MRKTLVWSSARSCKKHPLGHFHDRHNQDNWIDEKRFYQRIEAVLSLLNGKRTLDEIFKCNIDRWTWTGSFIDAFIRCAQNSSCFTQCEAKFVKSFMNLTAYKWRAPTKTEALLPPNPKDPRPQTLVVPLSSHGAVHRKHLRVYREINMLEARYLD